VILKKELDNCEDFKFVIITKLEMKMNNAKRILEDNGISPSLQRLIILRYLLVQYNHPSSEEVYQALIQEIPTLSKTTIYNTLKLFSQKGIIKQIAICGNELHYETQPGFHAHFLCEKCGKIFDFDQPEEAEFSKEFEGHVIKSKEVIYKGICRDCKGK